MRKGIGSLCPPCRKCIFHAEIEAMAAHFLGANSCWKGHCLARQGSVYTAHYARSTNSSWGRRTDVFTTSSLVCVDWVLPSVFFLVFFAGSNVVNYLKPSSFFLFKVFLSFKLHCRGWSHLRGFFTWARLKKHFWRWSQRPERRDISFYLWWWLK